MDNIYKPLLLTILATMFFLQCATDKGSYDMPVTATKKQKEELLEQCKKGKELFKVNCSECHGIFNTAKDKMPDFTSQQIDNYSAKFLRHDPRNHAVAKQMSPEQMNDVILFLRYRKIKKKSKI